MKGRQTSLLGTELLFTDDKGTFRLLFKKAKGKGRASTPQNGMESESMSVLPYNGETTMSSSLLLLPSNAGDQAAGIDALTGLVYPAVPPTRAPRKKKEAMISSRSTKKKDAATIPFQVFETFLVIMQYLCS